LSEKQPDRMNDLVEPSKLDDHLTPDWTRLATQLSSIPDFPDSCTTQAPDMLHTPAQEFCEDLLKEVELLRSQLTDNRQLFVMVPSPWGGPLRIASLAYRNPDMVIFRGERAELVSHVSAAQLFLVVVEPGPDEPQKDPIGFRYVGNVNATET
jgi:hypothetical protein